MNQSPTTVVVHRDRALGAPPSCHRDRRPASSLRGDDAGAAHSDVSDPGRGRSLLRIGARELAIAGAVYLAYWYGRTLTRDSHAAAGRNAARVIDLERSLGAFTERTVQRWAIDVPGMIELLNRYYVWIHFPATIAFLIWVFAVRREAYPTIRCWLSMVTIAGLVVHVLFPLAPPRMTPGFVDTLDVYGPDIYTDDTSRSVANQFAAMPSLHFGWALIVAIGLGRLTRRRTMWMVHPFVTLLAIVATGNHYWIDAAVAGALVVAAVTRWPGGGRAGTSATLGGRASFRRGGTSQHRLPGLLDLGRGADARRRQDSPRSATRVRPCNGPT